MDHRRGYVYPTNSDGYTKKAVYLMHSFFFGEIKYMTTNAELKLYRVIPSYIEFLRDESKGGDSRVQIVKGKESRPFIGIVTMCNGQKYCIPLTRVEGKEKLSGKRGVKRGSIDYSPIIINGEVKAGVQFSRMIPVPDNVLRKLDTETHEHDHKRQKDDKQLRREEIEWICQNKHNIINKAQTLYNTYISEDSFKRRDDCLNFPQLEKLCQEYKKIHIPQHHKQEEEHNLFFEPKQTEAEKLKNLLQKMQSSTAESKKQITKTNNIVSTNEKRTTKQPAEKTKKTSFCYSSDSK